MKTFRFEIIGKIEAETPQDADNTLYLTLQDIVTRDLKENPQIEIFIDQIGE